MQYNFKLVGEDLCCRICSTSVSVKTVNGWILKSNSEGDESKGICYDCLIEHCVNTNCLRCDWYKYYDCPHVETKKIYMEED